MIHNDAKADAARGTMRYVLALALACSTLSYMDRQVISLVVQPLKLALSLSDAEIGLLQGLAFTLCYAVAGLPLALAVDRWNRVRLASATIAIWSLATTACGLVSGYPGFLAARAVTAISEAGFSPAALSILSDLVPPAKVARIGAIYLLGPALGAGLALLVGGWILGVLTASGGLALPLIGNVAPWQGLFVLIGAPGILFSLILLVTVREPKRTASAFTANGQLAAEEHSLLNALRLHGDFLIPYVIGTTLIMLVQFAQAAWTPTFFVRQYGLAPHQVGQTLGPIFIVCAISGALTASFFARGATVQTALERVVTIVLCGALLLGPAAVLMPLVSNFNIALLLYALLAFSFSLIASLATAPMLLVMPSGVRGQSIAAGGFILAAFAGGGGPLAVGLFTDLVLRDETQVGISLAMVCGISVTLGFIVMLKARHILFGKWRQAMLQNT